MRKNPGNGRQRFKKRVTGSGLALIWTLFLTFLVLQPAHAFQFEKVTDFNGWWDWTNSPDSVDFYYDGDSVKIHSHVAPSEDYAWGNVAQEKYTSSIGVMTTLTAENISGYARSGIVYYDIGQMNEHEIQAQIFIERVYGSNEATVGYLITETLPEGWNELTRETIANVTGTTFTIALARMGNVIFFYLEGYDVRSFAPTFDLGSQGCKWGVFATTSLEGNAEATFGDIFAIDRGEPRPTITANGSTAPITVSPPSPVSVDIALDPGAEAGLMADWWVAVNTPFPEPNNWYTYVYPTGWQSGVHLCAQGPLFDLSPPFEVLDSPLPEGDYTFYFAIDPPDGILTADFVDSVEVHSVPTLSGWWDIFVPSVDSAKIDAMYLTQEGSTVTGTNILSHAITGTFDDNVVQLLFDDYSGDSFSGTLTGDTITGTWDAIIPGYFEKSAFHIVSFTPGETLGSLTPLFSWTLCPSADTYSIHVMRDNAVGNCDETNSCIGIWSMGNIAGTEVSYNSDGSASEALAPGNIYRVRVYAYAEGSAVETTMDVHFGVSNG